MKTLIITDTWDRTSDIIVNRISDEVFRLNTDIIRDYIIELNDVGFQIHDPTGRNIKLSEIGSVYWRKPFTSNGYDTPSDPDYFFFSECRYLIREIYNLAIASGAYSLVEAGAERRLGKIIQLLIAKKFFSIPEWNIILGMNFSAPAQTIVKSLSGEAIDSDNVLYTTRVDLQDLDSSHLWFTQKAIQKSADITACYIRGKIFAFELESDSQITDWRSTLGDSSSHKWIPIEFSQKTSINIIEFMKRCNLQYGRLDFVRSGEELFFLEVNPNGQWAWLDLDDRTGLISTMVNAIRGI